MEEMARKPAVLATTLSDGVLLSKKLGGFLTLYRRNARPSHGKFPAVSTSPPPDDAALLRPGRRHRAVVCDLEGGLLRSSSTFPYFMMVVLESGALLRAALLVLLYPLLRLVMSEEVGVRVMAMVCFCAVRAGQEGLSTAGRVVMPKHLMEDVAKEGLEVLMSGDKRVCVTRMPRVMVEGWLREYLRVEVVLGRELQVVAGFYTGWMKVDGVEEGVVWRELFGEEGDEESVVGLCAFGDGSRQHPLLSRCKKTFMVTEAERETWRPLRKDEYPKPLIFHDGRVAFRPTPLATLAMLVWLPFGCLVSVFRVVVFISLPYTLSIPILALTGMKNRLINSPFTLSGKYRSRVGPSGGGRGRLYVCNHRTLVDPLYVSAALGRHVTAVVYSLSTVSELLSPIRTVRLTRDREVDRRLMEGLLRKGEYVVVCPEGTTCREPFLLRFSALFAELSDEVVAVALNVEESMFYGNTARGFKWMDPFFLLANPFPRYTIEFVGEESSVRPDGTRMSSREMANHVQGVIAGALGFQCTSLTRRDKYLMLAGHDGAVVNRKT